MKYYWFGMLIIWIVLLSSIIQILAIDIKRIEQFKEHFELAEDEKGFIYLQNVYMQDKRALSPLIVGCIASIINCIVQIITL